MRGLTVDPAQRRVTVGEPRRGPHVARVRAAATSSSRTRASSSAARRVLARIWKGDTFVTERSVDALVKRLRRKIESDPGNPIYVLTVWGTGYKFADE